ncbi:MAG TPA: thiamine biosynthesis protein ApbE [Lachnospiraceae bacterium]|nr:thiamine biosynthesis protein ApbE [Lachnospiraceae bacterium]
MKRILLLILIIACFTGCSAQSLTSSPTTQSKFFLNTVSSITIYDMEETSATEIINNCFTYCLQYEQTLSKTIESSEISKINNAKGNWVTVSQDTIDLISLANKYSALSDGKFDCTIAPVSALWDFNSEEHVVPNASDIAEAVSHVNYKSIEIDGDKIRLTDEKAAIDLGGIAKGYIGDKAKDFLLKNGVEKAIINLGGNILTISPDNDNEEFKIGIQRPFDEQNTVYGILHIKNMSVVTSGTYERSFEKDGVLYHHILDTKIGMPVNNGLYSVTIIADKSAVADALSTTCFVLGLDEGMKLIESTPDIEAIFITTDYKAHCSSGINKTINFEISDEKDGE